MARSAETGNTTETEAQARAAASHARPVIEIDFAKYLELTKDFDATEEEQRELIAALHKIMLTFVDMGFDLCPVQHVEPQTVSCAQSGDTDQEAEQSLREVIHSLVTSDTNLTTAFDAHSKGAITP